MVVNRSQAASSQEQSSGQWTLLRGTASRIALLLFLLGSWLLIPDIRSNNFSHVIPITQAHIYETNKHFNLQGNEYIDDGNKYNKTPFGIRLPLQSGSEINLVMAAESSCLRDVS